MTATTTVTPAATVPAPCYVCGKTADDPHTSATRDAHGDHLARHGWSAMCVAPRTVTAKTEA